MPTRLDNEGFLRTLTDLLKNAETEGSVYLEQKRLIRTGSDNVLNAVSRPYPLLFRATDGLKDKKKRTAVSTIVSAEQLPNFWSSYAEALKKGMGGLRRKEKKRGKK